MRRVQSDLRIKQEALKLENALSRNLPAKTVMNSPKDVVHSDNGFRPALRMP